MLRQGTVENFLRVATAWSALETGDLLHAMRRRARQTLMRVRRFRRVGRGKSTVAGLGRAWTVLSDDLVLWNRNEQRIRGDAAYPSAAVRGDAAHNQYAAGAARAAAPGARHAAIANARTTARLAAAPPFVTGAGVVGGGAGDAPHSLRRYPWRS